MPFGAYIMAMPITAMFDITENKKTSLMSRIWGRMLHARQLEANKIVERVLNKN